MKNKESFIYLFCDYFLGSFGGRGGRGPAPLGRGGNQGNKAQNNKPRTK